MCRATRLWRLEDRWQISLQSCGFQVATGDLLKAKLTLPPAPAMSLSRPRLLDLMSESVKRPLTLLGAPAGFGKTTLLSAWVNETVDRPDVAWLGLDEDDNDPVRFFDYLRGALQRANVDVGRTAMAPLSGAGSPSPKDRMTSLLDDVTELDHSVVLVLDDYHAINNPELDCSSDLSRRAPA